MVKKIKWLLLGIVVILIISITYVVSLVRYAQGEVDAVNNYMDSISALPEVVSVHGVHRFNGLESYIVASVERTSGYDAYYFVRDGRVQYYFYTTELINANDANVTAQDLVRTGEIINTQLGILEGTPIFEVQIKDEDEDVVHYIVINAETSDIILKFYI